MIGAGLDANTIAEALNPAEEVQWNARRRATDFIRSQLEQLRGTGQPGQLSIPNPLSEGIEEIPLFVNPGPSDWEQFRRELMERTTGTLPEHLRQPSWRGSVGFDRTPTGDWRDPRIEMAWPADVLHLPMSQYLGMPDNFSPSLSITGRVAPGGRVSVGNENWGQGANGSFEDYIRQNRRSWGLP